MTIPQVNALATDRNRKQTKRICELKGYTYYPHDELDVQYRRDGSAIAWKSAGDSERLPNGSLAPCQVWGMLAAEGANFRMEQDSKHAYWRHPSWVFDDSHPHDLTAAMDALIKVLETKKGETK